MQTFDHAERGSMSPSDPPSQEARRKPSSLLALSAIWLIISLVVSYIAASFVFPLETETTSGWLGWTTSSERLFNHRAFLLVFVILVLGNSVFYLAYKQWFSGLFEFLWFAITAALLETFAGQFESVKEVSGILGFNDVSVRQFNVPLFVAIITGSMALNLWVRAEFINRPAGLSRMKSRLHLVLVTLICIAFVLYVAGLHIPIFKSTKFWLLEEEVTLIGSISFFFESNEAFLGVIIITFTIIFPLLKFIAVFWGLLAAPSKLAAGINHWFSILGKWSMLDVFVVALLLLNLKLDSDLLNMELRSGVVYFAISILLTMIVGTYAGRVRAFS